MRFLILFLSLLIVNTGARAAELLPRKLNCEYRNISEADMQMAKSSTDGAFAFLDRIDAKLDQLQIEKTRLTYILTNITDGSWSLHTYRLETFSDKIESPTEAYRQAHQTISKSAVWAEDTLKHQILMTSLKVYSSGFGSSAYYDLGSARSVSTMIDNFTLDLSSMRLIGRSQSRNLGEGDIQLLEHFAYGKCVFLK